MKKPQLSHRGTEELALDEAWLLLEREFSKPAFASPAPGFARRWQERQVQSAERSKRVHAAWTWIGVTVAFLLLAGLAWVTGNYASLASVLLGTVVAISASVVAFSHVALVLMDAIPLNIWASLIFLCGLLLYVWTALLRWAQTEKE